VTDTKTADIFWAEVSPCDHVVQIYENDETFLDPLEGFVAGGFRAGDAVVIIATGAHRNALNARLIVQGFDVNALQESDQYIVLDADMTLAKFMINGWPDEVLFNKTVNELLLRARVQGRKVRAFGEMVAVLWAEGHTAATIRLEHLWHQLCETESFSLFCAYPKSGFTKNPHESMKEICDVHSKVFPE
jgi:hypothetical protein